MYRYLVVEYRFEDDSTVSRRYILGAYPTKHEARVAAGKYITANVKKMKARYRDWIVDVQQELIFFPVKGI